MLQSQDLRVSQESKPYIRINTRKLDGENLMEFLGTKYLSYILTTVGLCSTTLAYSNNYVLSLRSTCVKTYCMILLFSNLLMTTWLCDCDCDSIMQLVCNSYYHDVMLNPDPK